MDSVIIPGVSPAVDSNVSTLNSNVIVHRQSVDTARSNAVLDSEVVDDNVGGRVATENVAEQAAIEAGSDSDGSRAHDSLSEDCDSGDDGEYLPPKIMFIKDDVLTTLAGI
jgi:hypothetical protein